MLFGSPIDELDGGQDVIVTNLAAHQLAADRDTAALATRDCEVEPLRKRLPVEQS